MIIPTPFHPKDPSDVVDYNMSFASLLGSGEAVSTGSATAEGVTVDSQTISGSTLTVFLSGGTAGKSATITGTITTDQGRTFQRSFYLRIQDR